MIFVLNLSNIKIFLIFIEVSIIFVEIFIFSVRSCLRLNFIIN